MKLTLTQLDKKDRPREKLMENGLSAMSDAELLAILIGSGNTEETAVQLMQRVLGDCNNNLNRLGRMPLHELMAYKGLGEAKAITIIAACELGRRRQMQEVEKTQRFDSAQTIYDYMREVVGDTPVEEAWLLMLNQNYGLIRRWRISQGGITETAVDVRLIMKEALLAGATVIALCHNHPSGNTLPSRDDDNLTKRVKSACETMRIHLLDHIIVTHLGYYSYSENGRL